MPTLVSVACDVVTANGLMTNGEHQLADLAIRHDVVCLREIQFTEFF